MSWAPSSVRSRTPGASTWGSTDTGALRALPRNRASHPRHVHLSIRTLTVGPGISPDQPAAGCGRVADFNRRCGFSPPPEHASFKLVGAILTHAGPRGAVRILTGDQRAAAASAAARSSATILSGSAAE